MADPAIPGHWNGKQRTTFSQGFGDATPGGMAADNGVCLPRDYFRRWILAALSGSAVLFAAGLYLTAIAVFLAMPLQAALVHLRCPGCDMPTTLQGVTDGRNCLGCGRRLRF